MAEVARKDTLEIYVAPTVAQLAGLTNRVPFDELWRRSELSQCERGLVAMVALISIGQPEQHPLRANCAIDNGRTPLEASEAITQVAFYAGRPRAMSAVPVLKQVFEDRGKKEKSVSQSNIKITRAGEGRAPAPEEYFTGQVVTSGFFKSDEPARVGGATVFFAAGARTAWHTHPLGQTLYIISGLGWIQKEGGPIEVMKPGDVVWIPAHVKHWHGASADQSVSHLAIAEALNGSTVTWMEKVTDYEYSMGTADR